MLKNADQIISQSDIIFTSIRRHKSGNACTIRDSNLPNGSLGISSNTVRDYRITLSKALKTVGLTPSTEVINHYLASLPCSLDGKYGYFKCLRAFYNWLHSPRSGFPYNPADNPVTWVDALKRPHLILPSLSAIQVQSLISEVRNTRDKAIIALFTESGLRLSELTNICPKEIDWTSAGTIRVLGKGRKEAYAPFGELSKKYLHEWLSQYQSNGNIWGINSNGI